MKAIKLWGTGDLVKNQTTIPIDGSTVYDHIEALEGNDIDNHINIRRSVRNLVDNDEILFKFMEAVFTDSFEESFSGILEDALKYSFRIEPTDIFSIEDNTQTAGAEKAFIRVRPGIAQVNGNVVFSFPSLFIAERELEKVFNLDTWHPIPESVEIRYDIERDLFHAQIKKKDQNLNVQVYDFTDPEFTGQGPAAFGDFESGGHPSAISLFKQIELHPTLGATFRARVAKLDAINLEPVFEIPMGETDIDVTIGIDANGHLGIYVDGYSEYSTLLTKPYFTLYEMNLDTTGSEIVADVVDKREYFRSLFKYVDDSVYVGKTEPERWTTRRFRVTEKDSEGDVTGNELNLLVNDGVGGTVEFRASDYPAWIDVTRNDRYYWKIRHDDGWKKASPDVPEDIGALSERDLGVRVPRLSDLGNAAFRNTGIAPNQVPLSSNIWLRNNIIVTVGPGGQFSTINSAITFLSNFKTTYQRQGITATIRLLDGFVMREQVLVNDVDLGWIRIETIGGIGNVSVSEFVAGSRIIGFDRPEVSTLSIENYTTFATTSRLDNQHVVLRDGIPDLGFSFDVTIKENLSNISDLNDAVFETDNNYFWFNVDENGTDPEVSEKSPIQINLFTENKATINDFEEEGDASVLTFTYLEDIFVGSQEYYIYFNVDGYYGSEGFEFPEPTGDWLNVFVDISASDSEADVATALAAAMNNISGMTASSAGSVVTFDTGKTEGRETGNVVGAGVSLILAAYDEDGVAEVVAETISNGFSAALNDNVISITSTTPGFQDDAIITNAGTSDAISGINTTENGSLSTFFYVWFNVDGQGADPGNQISILRIADEEYGEASDYGIEVAISDNLQKASNVISLINTAIDEFEFEYTANYDGPGVTVDSTDANTIRLDVGTIQSVSGNDLSIVAGQNSKVLQINDYPVGTEPLINHAFVVFDGASNLGHYFWINPNGLSTNPDGSSGFGEKEVSVDLGDTLAQVRQKISTAVNNEPEFSAQITSAGNVVITNAVSAFVTPSFSIGNNFNIVQTVSGVPLGFRTQLRLNVPNQFSGQRKELVVRLNGQAVSDTFNEQYLTIVAKQNLAGNDQEEFYFWFNVDESGTIPYDISEETNATAIELLSSDNEQAIAEKISTAINASDIREFYKETENGAQTNYDTKTKAVVNEETSRVHVFLRNQIFETVTFSGGSVLTVENFDIGDRVIVRDHVSATEEVDYNGLWFVYDTDDNWLELDFGQNENALFDIDRAGGTAIVASPIPVPVERAALTTLWEFFYRPAFGVARGTLPLIACDFEMDETGDNPYMSYLDGLCATDQGRINILPFCGFSNAGGTNIYGTRSSIINANDAIASRGKRYGIWAFANTIINARRAEVNDCGFGEYENAVAALAITDPTSTDLPETSNLKVDTDRDTFGVIDPIPRVNDLVVDDTGLEGYYNFDEEDISDSSGNSKDGSTTGTIIFEDSELGFGKMAVAEQGSSGEIEYFDVPNFQPGDTFTLSCWVAIDGLELTDIARVGTVLGKGAASNSVGIGFRADAGGENPRFSIGSRADANINNVIPANYEEFYHVVFMYKPGVQKGYINGKLEFERENPGDVGSFNSGNFRSFTSAAVPSGDSSALFGKIDQVRIYSRELSDQEVENLYFAPRPIEINEYEEVLGGSLDFTIPARAGVHIPNAVFQNGFNISAWVYRDATQVQDARLFDKADDELNSENGFSVLVSENGDVDFRINSGTRRRAAGVLPEEEWAHLSINVDEQNIMIYVDGEQRLMISNDTTLAEIISENPFSIGNTSILPAEKPFNGYIEEVRVYDFTLNPLQIQRLANESTAAFDSQFYKTLDTQGNPIGNGVYASRSSNINASEATILGSFADNVFSEFGSTINLDSEQGAEDTLQTDLTIGYSYNGKNVETRNAFVYDEGGVRGINMLTTVKQIG